MLFFVVNLNAVEFDISGNMKSDPKSDYLKYLITTSFYWQNHLEVMATYEQEEGEHFISYSMRAEQNWKYFSLVTRHFKTEELNQIYIEGLGRYPIKQDKWGFFPIKILTNGYWKLGYRQQWDSKIPSSNIVIGKSYDTKIGFFLTPMNFRYSLAYTSDDGKSWQKEISTRTSLSILSNLDFHIKYLLEDEYTQLTFGLSFKM